jgi:hypothetical protein
MSENLHVYANEVVEWMVAESPDDAIKVWEETTGMNYADEDGGTFEQEPDDKVIWIGFEENDEETERKTCREWANEKGRCYLCSSEY